MIDVVRPEIESLHRFFVRWFGGQCPSSAAEFETNFTVRFDPDFKLIQPSGALLSLSELSEAVRLGHGSNPEFRIEIRNARVHRQDAGLVLATYEEWQRNAKASKPPNNGRIATVLFESVPADRDLRWLHVHETWLPSERIAAGPYDF